ncbi:MAG: S49 family peptidase [Halobacteriales archaeon]
MDNPIDEMVATAAKSYTVIAVAAVLVGAAVFPHAVAFTAAEEQYIAVVTLDEPITESTSQATIDELQSLRANESVKAVVLKVSSPGGGAAASEALYMAVKRLAREKPVYTSVDSMAASGAYYTIIPSEEIFVKPGSIVGHVGVIATAPTEGLSPVVTSGPDKAHGGMTQDEFRASIETMKRGFVGAVMNERGEEITIPRSEVAKAKVFIGAKAAQNGYADQIGTVESAIQAAAADAGLSNYQVTYRNPFDPPRRGIVFSNIGIGENVSITTQSELFGYEGVETVQILMLYGTPEDQEVIVDAA